jgi:hypothetical protein
VLNPEDSVGGTENPKTYSPVTTTVMFFNVVVGVM